MNELIRVAEHKYNDSTPLILHSYSADNEIGSKKFFSVQQTVDIGETESEYQRS